MMLCSVVVHLVDGYGSVCDMWLNGLTLNHWLDVFVYVLDCVSVIQATCSYHTYMVDMLA